eukprot:1309911-Amphidinium_carterae.2
MCVWGRDVMTLAVLCGGAAPTMATAVVSTSPQLDATASPVVAASSPLELGASIIEPVAEVAS